MKSNMTALIFWRFCPLNRKSIRIKHGQILKDFADEHKNKFLLAKATSVSQATIARSAPIWFVRAPVIVLLGADFCLILCCHYCASL